MNRARFAGALAATAAAATAGKVLAAPLAPVSPYTPTLRFAVVCPQSGPDARVGRQLVDGVRAAVDEINRQITSFERALVFDAY
ncbi:MAG TPA: hypothetical protein VGC96_11370, partial [Candidatus Elarobacter sp.]